MSTLVDEFDDALAEKFGYHNYCHARMDDARYVLLRILYLSPDVIRLVPAIKRPEQTSRYGPQKMRTTRILPQARVKCKRKR